MPRTPPPNAICGSAGREILPASVTLTGSSGRSSCLLPSSTMTEVPSWNTSRGVPLTLTAELSSSICRFTRPTISADSLVTHTSDRLRSTDSAA